MCKCMWIYASAQGDERSQIFRELDLQAVVYCLVKVLRLHQGRQEEQLVLRPTVHLSRLC